MRLRQGSEARGALTSLEGLQAHLLPRSTCLRGSLMPLTIRAVLITAAVLGSAALAFAGASSVPTNYQPDPALRTASRGELEARIRKACTVTQAKLQNASEIAMTSPCNCYASRTLRSLDETEIQAYRTSGIFNDSARGKALGAIDACRLQRPT